MSLRALIAVLLLSNGKVLQGEILKDATGYVLKHKIGVMHFPGTGIQDNLADKAKRLGIPVWRFGGA